MLGTFWVVIEISDQLKVTGELKAVLKDMEGVKMSCIFRMVHNSVCQ